MIRKLTTGTAVAAAAVLAIGTGAVAHSPYNLISDGAYDNAKDTHAHEAQHGGDEGHLAPKQTDNLEVISETTMSRITEGGIADLAIKGDYAYLNSWGGAGNCGRNGVHVVDISDLAAPVEVGFIQSKEGSYPGEGAQVVSLDTASFTGDVLLTNNEICKAGVGFGGINLYDVTDPTDPENLAVGFGDYDANNNKKKYANQVHSVFGWQDGEKAYAVMVDNEEATDVDIVDITNPRKPVLVAEHDLVELTDGAIYQPGQDLDEVFLHDMVVKEIDGTQVMLASYWDGGYVTLDVDDPVNPVYLADSDFAAIDSEPADGVGVPPEGNAHQAEFTLDDEYVIAADEDFSPFALLASNLDDGTSISASPGGSTTPLASGQSITGESVYVGRACPGDPAVPAGDPAVQDIAVVERGVCTFTEKVTSVVAAGGYDAILIFNRTAADGCEASLGMDVAGDLPTFGVAPRSQGYAIFDVAYDVDACLTGTGAELAPIAIGTVGDELTFSSYFDGWGYVRLLDADTMTEVDSYAVPEARDSDYATGFGDLSVHEVATSQQDAGLAFLSYYAAGLRVIEVGAGGITEVGAFIDEGGNNFWGVEVFEHEGTEYVAASDRDYGLWIFEYTG
jgi:hypothetical protein